MMDFLQEINFNILASLASLAGVVAIMVLLRYTVFKIPAVAQTYAFNKEENKKKWKAKEIYKQRTKSSERVSLGTNAIFILFILPFFVTFEMQPVWKILLDIFLLLMVYDFFYYLMHRFLFHGTGYFKKVHGIHHQARSPTSVDALLLHPMEAFLGVALFMVVTVLLALILQEPFHVLTLIVSMSLYTMINQLNHVKMDLHTFPFQPFTWMAHKHSLHHIDMSHGNYATITLLFDKIFGTYE